MNHLYEHIEELIAKFLAGEATPEEAVLLQSWRAESDENQHYFEDLQQLWAQAPQARQQPPRSVDTEAALLKVKVRLQQAPQPALRVQMINRGFLTRAAAILLAIAGAFFLLRRDQANTPIQLAADTVHILTDTLTDGSVVTLNRNSGLSLAAGYNRKERRMKLRGEAYFEVAHNPGRPFIVEVQELEVKAVGTAFNVDNAANPGQVTVTVTEGKVLLSSQRESMLLIAGEQGLYDKKSGAITRLKAQQNSNVLAYKNKVFQFDATPLRTVIAQLNYVYGIRISVKNKTLENCELTARYNNLPLNRVLDLIAETFSIRVLQNEDGTIVLDGESCGTE